MMLFLKVPGSRQRAEPGAKHEVADLDPVTLIPEPGAEQVAADRNGVQAHRSGQDDLR